MTRLVQPDAANAAPGPPVSGGLRAGSGARARLPGPRT